MVLGHTGVVLFNEHLEHMLFEDHIQARLASLGKAAAD